MKIRNVCRNIMSMQHDKSRALWRRLKLRELRDGADRPSRRRRDLQEAAT